MRFIWADQLWLALLLPLLIFLYLWLMRRRKKFALQFSSLAIVKEAIGKSNAWRRHLPPVLLLGAVSSLIVAGARPVAVLTLPTQQQTVLLVMDVSGSMRATDVAPNRIAASQVAAKVFVAELPRNVRIGVVAYAGTAQLVQPPTLSRQDVVDAIDRFQLQRGTAIGSGIIVGLSTLFPEAGIDLSKITGQRNMPREMQLPGPGLADPAQFTPVPPGSHESAVMVVLTDGQNTAGPDPMEAAQMAADRGIKIFTVGFGTKDGEIIGFDGWSMRVRLDEDPMKRVANLTLGEYFYAGSGTDLKKVYEALKSRLVFEKKETEVTAMFAYLAGLLMIAATALPLWWFGRVA